MISKKEYKTILSNVLDHLPKDKIMELYDFAIFLKNQYGLSSTSSTDKGSLLLQQKSLSKIWDNQEEDVYEL